MKKAGKQDSVKLFGAVKAFFVRYRLILFIVFVGLVYIYTFWQINQANNAKPTAFQISENKHSPTAQLPHIDPNTVQKIEQLKDNSVNVKALFDKARENPFN